MNAAPPRTAALLAFDLSTPRAVVALGTEDNCDCRYHEDVTEHLSWLTAVAHAMLVENGMSVSELAGIIVGRGPGSFTGIRTAVMAAKTMAWSLGIPLAAPLTLDVVAAAARDGLVCATLDARRRELYYRLYDVRQGTPRPLIEPAVASPGAVADAVRALSPGSGEVQVLGNGTAAYPEHFAREPGAGIPAALYPSGEDLLRAGRTLLDSGGAEDPLRLIPFYLRPPDVGAAPACAGGGDLGS
ncbi:MAG: tRNA (adenosine(37)-N6)-threonylcarbamoyltransferase complex dimerization subunit type 1 TsaB [Candidatus Geothermincolia bacterium]